YPAYFREQMFHNLLVQKGYIVLDMDYRGSEGYGRDWRTAIYRNMGHPELEDYKDGLDWLVDTQQGDRDHAGIYGGSPDPGQALTWPDAKALLGQGRSWKQAAMAGGAVTLSRPGAAS
ncbi:prolyl oligopeptidase family serine peptidase, partial [Chromobacterium amazonense]|uniref:prolyl oligopeptidase family serine peptidase n=1 Tax=Chromobacterium amazonense TaxID=1382803 RepID=UPI0031F6FD96